ncbi:seipin [Marchantia polymorpha subsp. ruderalis]|uniref:Seipin n=2 Tax=Marchantia polymorpha TaxID=3197 RepID=A0A176WH19_MARPO|nr:hypothetical protein AXG93_2294s1100 [Marchantia polymorpha subsp. ruderalis]PTQ31108.1 hypothetical protein MARPO_0115s0029 [Marchantia polymorpha]BBN07946.1 hypothetical protein Mp_4g07520 [Marchantia polymorpha subsp. ruderalis]|eukprot:PTQ31108.1 hypothetical protein MARPO_0115s0029 [Marchantia polymorpha]
MEALRGEDSVAFDDESAEENYQSASDLVLMSPVGVAEMVDTVMSTVKAAVDKLPHLSLGSEGEESLRKEVSISDGSGHDEKEGQPEPQGHQNFGKGIQSEGDSPSCSDELLKEKGVSGSGASEDWSVVDPISEAQSVVPKNGRAGETKKLDQSGTANYFSSLSEEDDKVRDDRAEDTSSNSLPSSSKVAAEPEIQKLAAEKPSRVSYAAAALREPEIQEVEESTEISSHGVSSLSSVTDRAPFTYNDKPSSLRRRNRSLKVSDSGSKSVESELTSSYSTASPTPVSPRSHDRDTSWAFKDTTNETSDEWSKGPITRGGITQLKALEDLKQKGQVQDAQSEGVSSSGRNDTVDVEPMEPKRKLIFPSGYNSDTDDDDEEADSGIMRLGRRSANSKGKKKEAAGSSNQADEEDLTLGKVPRREVYKIPYSDDVEDLQQGGNSTHFLSWPAELLVQAVGFQVRLIIHVVAVALWMFNFTCSLISRPVHRTIQVKERATDMATDAVNQGFGLISQVREGVAQTGPIVTKLSKKTMMGCLGSAYVVFVLSLLLIPAFFVDLILVSRIVEEPVQLREVLNFDYTQARPSATFPVLSGQDLEKAKNLPLEKLVSFRKIPAGHYFHVNVILTMPESEYNIRLGMFQVTAEMLSARNQVLMRQSKPCMLRFRSAPIRLFKTVLYSIPLLMGFSTETQKIEVTVLHAQEKLVPTASVRILLEPKAGYPQGGGLPELYEAELHLESALPWPKAIMRRWKWTFYVWNGVCLFLFEVAIILCCCRQVLLPGLGGRGQDYENIVTGEPAENALNEGNTTKKSKGRRRVYFEDDLPVSESVRGIEGDVLPVSRSGEAGHLNGHSDDSDADAGWSMPPLEEAISTVEEGMRAMEETVKTLGETLVGGVSEGLGQALSNVSTSLDEK